MNDQLQPQTPLPINGLEELEQPEIYAGGQRREAVQFALKKMLGEQAELYEWADMLAPLQERGFRLDEAVFVAWCCMPSANRQPKTRKELAEMLGFTSPGAFKRMEARPDIQNAILALGKSLVLSSLPDVLSAAIEVAKAEDYKGHQDRKMLLTMAGLYSDQANISISAPKNESEMKNLSDEELERLAEGGNQE